MAQQPAPPPPPMGAPPTRSTTNGLAVAGMVLGICSIALFILSWIASVIGIVGLVLSLVGLSKSNQLGGVGRGMAIAGTITSAIGIVVGIIFLLVIVDRVKTSGYDFGMVLVLPAFLARHRG